MYSPTITNGSSVTQSDLDCEVEPGTIADCPDLHDPFYRRSYPEDEI